MNAEYWRTNQPGESLKRQPHIDHKDDGAYAGLKPSNFEAPVTDSPPLSLKILHADFSAAVVDEERPGLSCTDVTATPVPPSVPASPGLPWQPEAPRGSLTPRRRSASPRRQGWSDSRRDRMRLVEWDESSGNDYFSSSSSTPTRERPTRGRSYARASSAAQCSSSRSRLETAIAQWLTRLALDSTTTSDRTLLGAPPKRLDLRREAAASGQLVQSARLQVSSLSR